MPPPTPVPSTRTAPESTSARAPLQLSAMAAHLPSLAMVVGLPNTSPYFWAAGYSLSHEKAPPVWAQPRAVSMRPGIEMATPS